MTWTRQRIVFTALLVGAGLLVAIALVRLVGNALAADPIGEPGALTETAWPVPEDLPLPTFTDVSQEWGVADWEMQGENPMRGGVAIGDLDGDNLPDLVVTGGSVAVYRNTGDGFVPVESSLAGDAISASIADLDADGRNDLIIGFFDAPMAVSYGGWDSEPSTMGPVAFTTAAVVTDFNNDSRPDLAQLTYDGDDQVWLGEGDRSFTRSTLPNSDGYSMAASVFDATGDGSLNIWVTRDVGWADGPDSVYTWTGSGFEDVSAQLGGAQAVDGMGVTAADLSGDGYLDVYVSDLGDNELLTSQPTDDGARFELRTDSRASDLGVARIRPPNSGSDTISSSWSSGATDINHDGVLDLIVANGGFANGVQVPNKIDGTEIAIVDPPAVFLGRGDGTYVDVWADIWPEDEAPFVAASRGMAIGDLDGDLDADIVMSNFAGGLMILRNDTPGPVGLIRLSGCIGAHVQLSSTAVFPMPFGTVIGAQSFLGHHAAELTVGGFGEESGPDRDILLDNQVVDSAASGTITTLTC